MFKQIASWLFLVVLLSTVPCYGSALLLTCNVGGAKLEKYDDNTHTWKLLGGFPRLIECPRYTYIMVRATADGFQEVEKGIEVKSAGQMHEAITLEPDNPNPNSQPMFSIGGQVTKKSGLSVFQGAYIVLTRNMTTYKTATYSQAAHDENPVDIDGWYTNTFADLTQNKAASVGDRLFVGVYNLNKSFCYGYKYLTLTEENISRGYVIVNVVIK